MALEDIDVRVTLTRQEDWTVFDRKVRFVGNLDQSQRVRLLEIVNHCPVHKVLTGRIRWIRRFWYNFPSF